jgi:hypothetical protein
LVVCGPSETGKSFLLEALGAAAVEAGMHVAWFTLESLSGIVRRHRVDDTITKVVARIVRADLIAVDDIGLLPVAGDAAEGLFRVVDAAYERRSVAISSNLHPAGFDELMPKTLATATVDRLLHDALPHRRRQRASYPSHRRRRRHPTHQSVADAEHRRERARCDRQVATSRPTMTRYQDTGALASRPLRPAGWRASAQLVSFAAIGDGGGRRAPLARASGGTAYR